MIYGITSISIFDFGILKEIRIMVKIKNPYRPQLPNHHVTFLLQYSFHNKIIVSGIVSDRKCNINVK